MNSKLFLIDICGTIYRSNTTFDFIEYWFAHVYWYKRLNNLRKFKFIGRANYVFYKIFGLDLMRNYVISKLGGITEQRIKEMTKEFYDCFLSQVANPSVIDIIAQKRSSGYRLIIVSATLDCIAKEVANRLNVPEYFSSELDYKNGICTGHLKTDWLASKLKNLNCSKIALYDMEVITDNYSDIELIEKSKQAYLIQYKNKKNKWMKLLTNKSKKKCNIIEI